MPTGVDLSISGLASGFDWKTVVSQLAQAERSPETKLLQSQNKINSQKSSYTIIGSYLTQLQTSAKALKDPTLFDSRSALSSDTTVATASASAGGLSGTFNFNISSLATAASYKGTGSISKVISPDGNLSAVTVGAAGFATQPTAGTFTINGAQVTIATTDSLQQVFDNIAAATGNGVIASYDSTADKITLTSANPAQNIVLGSGADTSNFLQVAKLYSNSSSSISSTDTLGRMNTSSTLSSAELKTAVTDGGSGAGQFKINGIAIAYDASTDTMQNVIDRINSSSAGVTAGYDVVNNRFTLANKTTGDVGIAMQDVTGNFLAATGLAGGALSHGTNLSYTVNGGATIVSQSNTIDQNSSGVTGLSLAALKTGVTSVTVSNDTTAVESNLQTFINAYNNVQSYITTQSATSTDATGKVVAGLLTGDTSAANIATSLRAAVFSPVSIPGLSATFSQLANLGIASNGHDNTITLSDSTALDKALAGNLSDVKKMFTDPTGGLGAKLNTFLDHMVGDSGTVPAHTAALAKRSTDIDKQITNLEKTVAADSAQWTKAFQAMELAQSQISQQLNSLTQQINKGTL